MYQTTISIAGLTIAIEHHFKSFQHFAKAFTVTEKDCDFLISVSEEDIEKERVFVEKQSQKEGRPIGYLSGAMLEETAIYRKIADHLIRYQALVFHGSAVAVGNTAVVFSAISGTGKTTHTRLWLKNVPGSYVVNGDKPILRVIDGKVFVCGTPWNGKEHLGENAMVPLTAICKIHRSPDNRIEQVDSSAFLPHLLEQTHCPDTPGAMVSLLPVLKQVVDSTSFYALYCNMEDDAALLAAKTLLP